MKLSVIDSDRKPASVSPKIRVYDTEEELNNDLANLPSGAIVATKEDDVSKVGSIKLPVTIDTTNNKVTIHVDGLFQNMLESYQITYATVTSTCSCSFSLIGYKNWNDALYYSVLFNTKNPVVATGEAVIESVTKDAIVYKVVGNIEANNNGIATAIKL